MARTDTLPHFLTDVADAIRTKKGTQSTLQASSFDTEILSIPSGAEPTDVIEKDVNFYDYDGTRVYSYTKTEFLALEEMPANPTHTGLTAQGWNWTYQNAITYVTNNGILDVGQMYITSDGKTRIYLSLTSDTLDLYLTLGRISDNGVVTVNWGDNSSTEEMTHSLETLNHTYSAVGDYVITLSHTEGTTFRLVDEIINNGVTNSYYNPETQYVNMKYKQCITKVEIGAAVDRFTSAALRYSQIKSINLPTNITSCENDCFAYCYNLKGIVIPTSITSINPGTDGWFRADTNLKYCILPDTLTSISGSSYTLSMWNGCSQLKSMIIPISMTTLPNGFFYNLGIKKAIIPTNITQMSDSYYAGTFQQCSQLEEVSIAPTMTKIGWRTFQGCYSLKQYTIPSTVTEIQESAFQQCSSLTEINLPEGLTTIGQNAFMACQKILQFTFPSTITSIGQYAFSNANNRTLYDFSLAASIPTLANSNAFSGASDYKIVVPDSLYTDWIATNNWSGLASHIISKTDYDNL